MLHLIRQKISLQLLSLYLLFVIPVLLGSAGLYVFQQNVLTQNAFQSDLGLAQAVALEVGTNLRAATEIDSELSTAQAAKDLDLKQLASVFANASNAHPDISLYYVCDPSGKMIINYPFSPSAIGQNFASSDYFQAALKSDAPFVSSGSISAITDSYVVSVAARITNDKGRIAGVMVINLSLDQLTSRLNTIHQRLSPSSEVGLWVIDRIGQTIATTKGIFAFLDLPEDYDGLIRAAHDALQGKAGNFISHAQTRDWLYSYVPIPEDGWAIVVQRPTDITFAALTNFQHGLIAALALLILGATFFWFMMHRRVISPLTRLAKAVSQIQPDQPVQVMHTGLLDRERGRRDEIGNLVAAFSAMEREIHSHFQRSDETIRKQFYTLDAIMRSMDEGVLLESPDGRIVYANHIFSREVGIPQQELINSRIQDHNLRERLSSMFARPESYHEVVEPVAKGRRPHVVEFPIRGSYKAHNQFIPAIRDIRMRLFHVRDAKGTLIGRGRIFEDITRQNEAERIKSNLLAIVSHELRTPLTAIKGFATSLLEETAGEVDTNWQEYSLGQIVTESNRMADLVTSLLEMAQVEAGTLKLYPGAYLLRSLLEDALASIHNEHDRVQVSLPEDVPLLYVDGRRIQIVLCNILENAQRYGGPDVCIEISASYEHGQAKKRTGLTLHITDNGPGIPPHLVERVFDRFYQVESGHERSSSGVGLGLAICRGFVEAHGGRIWVENRSDGKSGAVFHLWFPPTVLRAQERQQQYL
ncbi:MAG TPA: ATP-binding protein [Ktedonobacteraceae bacterium]|nr:ATP-binding protein [Ktedonobacteraceae bacterium]